jgi:branched-chain amino acid transport system permease protein
MIAKRSAVLLVAITALLLALAAPMLGDYPRYVLVIWLIFSLSAMGLNLVIGYGQLYSLGHGGFMLVGAYVTGIAISRWGWSPIPAFVAATLSAAFVGFAVGLPAIRLRHFSLAIVTFAFAVTLFHVVKSFAYTGGPQGIFLQVVPLQRMLGGNLLFYVALGLNVTVLFATTSITDSKTGRALRLIGVNETVARSFGIDVVRYKLSAFALSGSAGAMAGSLHALTTGFVAPETYGADLSIAMFAAVMIGGKGRLLGPFLGAAFIVGVPEITQDARALAQIIYASLFIVSVTLLPNGLLGMFHNHAVVIRKASAPRGQTALAGEKK